SGGHGAAGITPAGRYPAWPGKRDMPGTPSAWLSSAWLPRLTTFPCRSTTILIPAGGGGGGGWRRRCGRGPWRGGTGGEPEPASVADSPWYRKRSGVLRSAPERFLRAFLWRVPGL